MLGDSTRFFKIVTSLITRDGTTFIMYNMTMYNHDNQVRNSLNIWPSANTAAFLMHGKQRGNL